MAVYVDPLRNWGWILRGRKVKSCHMIADSLEELHEMAQEIGLKKSWFQNKRNPHYDLTRSLRNLAIKNGAIALEHPDFIRKLRKFRENL